MAAPTPAPHRLLRAAVAASVATMVAAAAHLVGGGSVSVPGAVAASAGLLGPLWLSAGRERGWAAIAGLQLAGQQVVHALLEMTAGHSTHGTPLPEDISLYSHLAAAALIAAWLRCGERHLWTAARRTVQSVAAWWRWVVRLCKRPWPTPIFLVPAADAPRVRPGVHLRHVVVRRGPPLPA